MWNPFKKKVVYQDRILLKYVDPDDKALNCVLRDPDVDTAVGYKDLEGRFFDDKEKALQSNIHIKKQESINKLSTLILKMFGYPSTDNTGDQYWYLHNYVYLNKKEQARSLAESIHADPSILKDYLNENY